MMFSGFRNKSKLIVMYFYTKVYIIVHQSEQTIIQHYGQLLQL